MAKLTDIVGLKADIVYVDTEIDKLATKDGDLTTLTTNAKDNLVNAINEVDLNIDTEITNRTNSDGDLTTLTTNAKDNLVNAINEVDSKTNKILSIVRYDVLTGDSSTTDFEVTLNSISISEDISTFLNSNASVFDGGVKILHSEISFSFDSVNAKNNVHFNTAPTSTVEIEAIQLI